jgi:hypothetical protein
MESNLYQSANINQAWLSNVYENLKNLEGLERLAREGCISLLDYVNMPMEIRTIQISDIQFKNLRLMVTEFSLLLTDLTPIIEKTKHDYLKGVVSNIDRIINERSLFIKDSFSQTQNRITKSETTHLYWETITILTELREEVIREIAHLLFYKPMELQ